MGTITSDNFSMTAGATYEISGTLKNLSGTGGKHVAMTIRQDILNVLYADRVVDAIATGSGMNFSAYVTANTTAADAQLVFFTTSAFSDIELDNLVVRQVTGLTRNPRTNEVRLMVNTGSTSGNFSCPGGGGCSLQYRDITDTAVAFPVNIVAHSSQIILWRDPNSNFTPTNILHKPNGTFVPSAGSIANNESVDLSWTSNNATNVLMSGSTNTGGFTYILGSSGAVTIFPPNDGTNTYTLSLENDIGFTTYTADVVTSNTPPVTVPSFATGSEDALSITGAVTATDINSG